MTMEYEYKFDEGFRVAEKEKRSFDKYGCLMIRNLLSKEEVDHVIKSFYIDEYRLHTYGVNDNQGRKAHITLWNHPGNDVAGMLARSEKVAGTCEQLLGGEVYHYHSKLMGKPPREGGCHLWHQDYGYWYDNGCLFPDMLTVFIALDKCEKANGCLQYLPGSHLCGRVDHHKAGQQAEADSDRVAEIKKVCPLQYAEMEPGDALITHCNVLHSSDANTSEFRRWALLCCYNKADNNPVKVHHHPQYTPLKKVPNSSILSCKVQFDIKYDSFIKLGEDKPGFGEEIYQK